MKITRRGPTVYLEEVGEVRDGQTVEVSDSLGRELRRRGDEWSEVKAAARAPRGGGD